MATQHDLIVRGGTVVDGTGAEPFAADVAVRDGRIAAVGSGLGAATEEIDAGGTLEVVTEWIQPNPAEEFAMLCRIAERSPPRGPATVRTIPCADAR